GRQGFGWERWSSEWLYEQLGLFNNYRLVRWLRWTPFVGQFFVRSYLGRAGLRRRRGAAIHSGLESALGSHPCVALSSYQAPRL
ncbi:MAG TPA: hypothetical protein VEO92_08255, partial [Candidatus Nitrosocosmicus sp.]|nr:hypothetical protein [Candidatus Nitrosocosmicus sp.]